jgi:microcystin-dependent protein
MGSPFVGEIRIFAGNFAPVGWMFCQGQTLPISENEVLFQLIGTTYGGDGEETFQLPDLQSRVPIHQGSGPEGFSFIIGQNGGTETVTLSTNQSPVHSHPMAAVASPGTLNKPDITAILSDEGGSDKGAVSTYFTGFSANSVTLAPASIGITGGNQPHDNLQPYLTVSFIISLFGIFPPRN